MHATDELLKKDALASRFPKRQVRPLALENPEPRTITSVSDVCKMDAGNTPFVRGGGAKVKVPAFACDKPTG